MKGCAILLLLSSWAWAQLPDLKVRLYSAHPVQQILIQSTKGELIWRSCEQCRENTAQKLEIKATGEQLELGEGQKKGARVLVTGSYKIITAQQPELSAAFPLRIQAHKQQLQLLAGMPLEDYVTAALAGESGSFKNDESLKAMAVAIRTYAAHFRPNHAQENFDFCDSTHCQALNFAAINPRVLAAASATRGQMLWYKGVPAATYYHQSCGGMIAAGEEVWPAVRQPYLTEHVDPYCSLTSAVNWQARLTRNELEEALRAQGMVLPKAWSSLRVLARGPSGRATRLIFQGGAPHAQVVPATAVRLAVGRALGWNRIRSDLYDVQTQGDLVIFTGHGSGHGVGLCQAGAEEMAHEGKTYKEILAFYYPGTSLNAASDLNWQKRASEHFELLSTNPEQESQVLDIAERLLKNAEDEVGWKIDFHPTLQVFPSLDVYRNGTGKPGWVAASTRGHVIRLQPLQVLREKSSVESTLRHEIFHLVIEDHARPDTPLWLREGLVLYLSGDLPAASNADSMSEEQIEVTLRHPQDRAQMEQAYAAARTHVAALVGQYGKKNVLSRLSAGLPGNSGLRQGSASQR